MARRSLLSRLRPQAPTGDPEPSSTEGQEASPPESPTGSAEPAAPAAEAAAGPRRPLYHPGVLRRERRTLVRVREERIRDLGGLILEMFRRDRFREDLMRDQADEIFGLESRIQEIDALLTTRVRGVPTSRCECGAPIVWGARFCANCGRPTGEAVVKCENCGHPLPADARFCGNCGTTTPRPVYEAREDSEASEPPADGSTSDGSSQASDSWER